MLEERSSIRRLAACFAAGSLCLLPKAAFSAERPNIVFIMADDLGPDGFGCYGSMNFSNSTPRIDTVATNGMRFTHAYCTGICSPTRAQYLTGQYPFRNGVLDIDGSNYRSDPNKPNLTQVLRDAGYTTGGAGKSVDDEWASTNCMNEYLSSGTGNYYDYTGYSLRGPTTVNPANYAYFPDAMQAYSLDFLERNCPRPANSYKPFYFYYALINPHSPILATPDSTPGETNLTMLYHDNIKYIDKVVGGIVDKLTELGILDTTMLLIAGDNGSWGYQSKLWDPNTSTYRTIHGSKADRTQNREGTSLVPLIVHWPAVITTPSVETDLVDFTDMLPTYADVAGGSIPTNWVQDRKSFAPLLRGSPNWTPREWIYSQIQNIWCVRGVNYRLDRDGRFFSMSDAPFSMPVISSLTPQQETVRASLQAVLNDFDPANGPTYEGHQDKLYNIPVWNWKKTYWNWSNQFETASSGDSSDPDGDGVPNILERAFGWNPKIGTNTMPKILYNGTTLAVTYSPAGSGSDVKITVDAAFSLTGTWDSSAASISTTGSNPLTSTDRITNAPARFMRLRASRITQWAEP